MTNKAWTLRANRLPRYAWGYVDDLREDYLAVTNGDARTLHPELFDVGPPDLTWSQLYTIEAAILKVEPAQNLSRIAWRWRLRFRNIAGPLAYQTYLDSNPPDPATATPDALRADLSSLVAELHYRYLLVPAREETRDQFYKWSLIGIAVALALIGGTVVVKGTNPNIPIIAMVMFSGLVGGLVSVQQRLQSLPDGDPLFGALQISSSKWSIFLAPFLGAIFAIVLYLLFVADLVSGGLFPKIITAMPHTGATGGIDFEHFLTPTGPDGGASWAKLLVWSFIAGFAERLVPDILNKLVERAQAMPFGAGAVMPRTVPPTDPKNAPNKTD